MKALVTGATGFVGPYLLRHLSACGDDVVGPGDATTGFDVCDRDAVLDVLTMHRPEVVYHLAARSHVGASWHDPIACLRVNVEGTANVLDAAVAVGVRRVLVVGSAEEYGRVNEPAPITEEAPAQPLTPYGASKAAAAMFALQAQLAGTVETVRVRPFSHTGPGQSPAFVIPALAGRVARAEREGHDEVRIGARTPVRDISDVRDVVRAYRMLMCDGVPGDVYNVCRGVGIAIGEIAAWFVAHATRALTVESDPQLTRATDVPYLVGDPGRLVRATGWEPEFTLDQTFGAVLAHARAQGS